MRAERGSRPRSGFPLPASLFVLLFLTAAAAQKEGDTTLVFGGNCMSLGFKAEEGVSSGLADKLTAEFLELGRYHGILDMVQDQAHFNEWLKMLGETGKRVTAPAAESAGNAAHTPAYYLEGEATPAGSGQVNLNVRIRSVDGNAFLYNETCACDTVLILPGDRPCIKTLVERAFRNRRGKGLAGSPDDSAVVAVMPFQSDYLDSADKSRLEDYFRDDLSCDKKHRFPDFNLPPPPPSAILPGSKDLDARGIPLNIALAMALNTRAGRFIYTTVNREKAGSVAAIRMRVTGPDGRQTQPTWSKNLDIPADSSLPEYKYLVSEAAHALFAASCSRKSGWSAELPLSLMPAIPGIPLFLGEGESDGNKQSFLDAHRPAYSQSRRNPKVTGFSAELDLARELGQRWSLLFSGEWTRMGNIAVVTGVQRRLVDSIPSGNDVYVEDGPEGYRSESISRFQSFTIGAGMRYVAAEWLSRSLVVSFSGSFLFGMLDNRVSILDSSLSNQTLLRDGTPLGKTQYGSLKRTVISLQGPLVGTSLSADLRIPLAGWLWSEIGAGAKIHWAHFLKGRAEMDSIDFQNSYLAGYAEQRGSASQDMEWSQGNLLGNGDVMAICPSGGNCPDDRNEMVKTEPADKIIFLPFLRFSLVVPIRL